MVVTLLGISIIVEIISGVICRKNRKENGTSSLIFSINGIILAILIAASLLLGLFILTEKSDLRRLEIVTEENKKIETEVSNSISKYIEHEKGIFVEIKPSQINTYLVAYPDLQASELIKYQIDLLNQYNKEIKEIKSDLCQYITYKRILYFGD